ncbi:hypothetical protein ACHAXT_012387 [Thalassiosira profunda]
MRLDLDPSDWLRLRLGMDFGRGVVGSAAGDDWAAVQAARLDRDLLGRRNPAASAPTNDDARLGPIFNDPFSSDPFSLDSASDPFSSDPFKVDSIIDPFSAPTANESPAPASAPSNDPFAGDPFGGLDLDPFDDGPLGGLYDGVGDLDGAGVGGSGETERRERSPNLFPYEFFDVFKANWYTEFLQPSVRERTYALSSRDRDSDFRSYFRVPLTKVDELVGLFLREGWIAPTKHCKEGDRLKLKAELLIMGALNVLGNHTPFRQLKANTQICRSDHQNFFHLFLDKMYARREEYIFYPRTPDELRAVMKRYADSPVHLPGNGGSIDVVHLKWSNCPAGDMNRCVGKEGYPTLAFEVISGYDREIMGVSSVQFGTRNDKHIVRLDETVDKICNGWYNTVEWEYYDVQGRVHTDVGVYLICDGGYLRWPTLICPYKGEPVTSTKGHFSSHLESIRKDVECVFGILKKRWKILEYGIRFRDIEVVEKVFVVCCMLHNMMLTEMETRDSQHRVGRGAPNAGDAIWLEGERPTPPFGGNRSDHRLAMEWGKRRKALAAHLEYSKAAEKRRRVTP